MIRLLTPLCPLDVITARGQSNTSVTITLPLGLNLTNAASVTVRSLDTAVAVPQGGQTWFLKMKGPAELVGRQQGNFEAFAKSVRFE